METEKEAQSIYDFMVESSPDVMMMFEDAIKKGMPEHYVVAQFIKSDIPDDIKAEIIIAIKWKYKQTD